MERHLQVVRLLADGERWSGEAIAGQLGISRAAVWKAVRKAAETLELEIESVRGHGYRLATPLELLDAEAIRAALTPAGRLRVAAVTVFQDIDSTNTWLAGRARAGDPGGSICLAERQHAGRGRRGRCWVSPFGGNIALSLLWRFAQAPAELGGLSLAAGVAVAKALEQVGATEVGLKWPNDLHWRRRKLAGLLLEVAGEAQGPSWAVIGVGVNLQLAPAQAQAIDQPWVDLATVLDGQAVGRNRVVATLIDALLEMLAMYAAQGLAPFVEDWRARDAYQGEPVLLVMGERQLQGRHAGIDPDGALRLDLGGEIRRFQAGEVSLRSRTG
ncbi:bifunctional biotin--[acetyl-CoA-carboxylase] ligase/biotin operon repressor BirA [Thiohalocapsa marina]|uniref:Bifunctional ligase/repressor BirA n=1 Tax=Thiohalocapsa marina TaxID=424902 RepID=A0A5M8FT48_9GAMM|nr:bifunctional biotin--[acetyl-CoA-carboxylase] ligase/biotin operon repressor BirA [Thiohalocapsa marina]KAA6186976.1 bifunctional biotin--[acetyl-CoA-carboxylase] ligase/biotin operon repressor BirA [Thiohalocapsa marina]